MKNFFKKQLIAMSSMLAVALPLRTPADKPVFPQEPEICTMNVSGTPFGPFSDEPDVPKP